MEQRSILRNGAAQLLTESKAEPDPRRAKELRLEADQLLKQVSNYWKADWRYLAAAGLLYAVGMVLAAWYWKGCLEALGQRAPPRTLAWAYFYGNLGKYFPGKAMVIVLRVTALSPAGVRRVPATMTVFIETLTMMSVGAAMAAFALVLLNIDWRLTILAAGLIVATLMPTHPPLLQKLLARFHSGVDPKTLSVWSSGISYGLILRGWMILAWTWIAFGLSLGLVILGLPTTQLADGSWLQFWLGSLGACAMAVVLGFVSLVPGGAGVREATLSLILAPIVGPLAAVSCAIWLRITWLTIELAMAAACYWACFLFPQDREPAL